MSEEKSLPPLPQFRDLTELGEKLGLNNLNSLYTEIKEGNLIAYKFGKSYKVPVEEFERYLESKKKAEQGYDLGDIAEALNVGIHYLYAEAKRGHLQIFKVGKSYKVKPEDYQRYLESKKSSPDDEESGDEE